MARSVFIFVWLLPSNVAIGIMQLYRLIISPLYGQVCRYYPSCSRYALMSYQSQGFVLGTVLTAWRLLRCNPWSSGGIDDPRPLTKEYVTVTKHGFLRAKRAGEHSNEVSHEQTLTNQHTKGVTHS